MKFSLFLIAISLLKVDLVTTYLSKSQPAAKSLASSPRSKRSALAPAFTSRRSSRVRNEEDSVSERLQAEKLNQKIKELAYHQLKLSAISEFNYTDYEIENWPNFVSVCFFKWDSLAISEIRAALPTLKFIPKSQSLSSNLTLNRRKLLDLLHAEFAAQTGISVIKLPWWKYHIRNWPVGVSYTRFDHWNSFEILEIYRHLKQIKFIPVGARTKIRTITLTDGVCIRVRNSDRFVKRVFRKKISSNSKSSDEDAESSSSSSSESDEEIESEMDLEESTNSTKDDPFTIQSLQAAALEDNKNGNNENSGEFSNLFQDYNPYPVSELLSNDPYNLIFLPEDLSCLTSDSIVKNYDPNLDEPFF